MKIATMFLWFAAATTVLYGQMIPQGPPDAVYYNGKIITVDSPFSIHQAFAVKGDRFEAVGTTAQMKALSGKGTRMVDLQGHAVIPGLQDNHYHLQRAAFYVTRRKMLDLTNVASMPELFDRLRKTISAAGAKPGEVLIGSGGWDLRGFAKDRRAPTRAELDPIAPQNPLVVIRSRNLFFLNSAAVAKLGLTRDMKEFGGVPLRKDANGEPAGIIAGTGQLEAVMDKLFPPLTDEEEREAMLKMQDMAVADGLTSVRELSINAHIMRIYQDWQREGKLKVRIAMGLDPSQSGVRGDAKGIEAMLAPWGVYPPFGDDWLRLDSVAEIGNVGNVPPEAARDMMLVINKYGWRPAIHISDEYLLGQREAGPVSQLERLDRVLDAYEAADRVKSIKDRRWVVEHVPQMRPDQMDRIVKLGVVISAQHGPYYDGPETIAELGKEAAGKVSPVREWLDKKIVVSFGTDWPGRPQSPFINIYYFVSRHVPDGQIMGLAEKVTREEALRMGTIYNAYTTFSEKITGSIEPGKLADFLVLPADIMTVPEEQIFKMRPLATFVGGRKMFSAPEGGSY